MPNLFLSDLIKYFQKAQYTNFVDKTCFNFFSSMVYTRGCFACKGTLSNV